MNRAHAFAAGVEWQLVDTRQVAHQRLLIDASLIAATRIAASVWSPRADHAGDRPGWAEAGVIAQHGCAEQKIQVWPGEARRAVRDDLPLRLVTAAGHAQFPAVQPDLPDRHLVLGQRAALIGADVETVPKFSMTESFLTRTPRCARRWPAIARVRVSMAGSPSGTAATRNPRAQQKGLVVFQPQVEGADDKDDHTGSQGGDGNNAG